MFVTLLLQSVPESRVGLRYGIPEVEKGIRIPIGLLEARHGLDASLDAIDTDVTWTESHYWTVLLMRIMYRLVLGALESSPENPERREAGGEVCGGYFGKRGEEDRVEDESVDREQQEAYQCQ